ncbi:hypothetical protein ACFL56_01625 [Candidatus Margulisiibacteriota bacterium]
MGYEKGTVTCPNCKHQFKGDVSKKYQDCPECKFEFKLEESSVSEKETGTSSKFFERLKEDIS